VKTRFILNPNSGNVKGRPEIPDQVRAFILAHNLKAELAFTQGPRHAAILAREARVAGYDTVVSMGGDGTINEVGSALLDCKVRLGIIPLGSGNGLARDLRIPLRIGDALETLLHAVERRIDVGTVDERPFFCSMGLGFDAAVIKTFDRLGRRGLSAYVEASLRTYPGYKPECFSVFVDGRLVDTRRALLLAVANAAQYGNNAVLAPKAKPDDGVLNLVSVADRNPLSALPLVWRLFSGSLDQARGVLSLAGPRFTLEREQAGPMHIDGELAASGQRVEIGLRPLALTVLVPPKAKTKPD
jgi:YegS/Rv2252/BmrU family lipid kinase